MAWELVSWRTRSVRDGGDSHARVWSHLVLKVPTLREQLSAQAIHHPVLTSGHGADSSICVARPDLQLCGSVYERMQQRVR